MAPDKTPGGAETAPRAALLSAYARAHPAEFVADLSGAGAADCDAVIDRLPEDAVAAILAGLPHGDLDRRLARDSPATVARWIRSAPEGAANRLFRRLPQRARAGVLANLPGARRRTLERAAAAPADSVGAICAGGFAWVADSASVAEAVRRLAGGGMTAGEPVLVLDRDERLVGRFDALRALTSDPRTPARELAFRTPVLRAEIPARAAIAAAGWEEFSSLPVVDRERRPIGIASRAQLLSSRRTARSVPADFERSALMTPVHLFSAFGRTLAGWAERRRGDRGA